MLLKLFIPDVFIKKRTKKKNPLCHQLFPNDRKLLFSIETCSDHAKDTLTVGRCRQWCGRMAVDVVSVGP